MDMKFTNNEALEREAAILELLETLEARFTQEYSVDELHSAVEEITSSYGLESFNEATRLFTYTSIYVPRDVYSVFEKEPFRWSSRYKIDDCEELTRQWALKDNLKTLQKAE